MGKSCTVYKDIGKACSGAHTFAVAPRAIVIP